MAQDLRDIAAKSFGQREEIQPSSIRRSNQGDGLTSILGLFSQAASLYTSLLSDDDKKNPGKVASLTPDNTAQKQQAAQQVSSNSILDNLLAGFS